MKLISTKIEDLLLIENLKIDDNRGSFNKIFNFNFFKENNLNTVFKEQYYSISRKNTLRGFHFQIPPEDHIKIVNCIKGEVLDVVVDLRKNSNTFGCYEKFILNENDNFSLYIGKGLAHGFYSKKDQTIMFYNTSSQHSPNHDYGIFWNSLNIDWGVTNPILSKRDKNFPKFSDFVSPF